MQTDEQATGVEQPENLTTRDDNGGVRIEETEHNDELMVTLFCVACGEATGKVLIREEHRDDYEGISPIHDREDCKRVAGMLDDE